MFQEMLNACNVGGSGVSGEGEVLYSSMSPEGTWGESNSLHTISDLNQYKLLVIGCYNSSKRLLASTIVPVNIFKQLSKISDYIVNYVSNSVAVICAYKNDTQIGCSSVGCGLILIGIK